MNGKDILSDLTEKVNIGKKLGAFNDRLGQKLLQLYNHGILDSWSIGQITSRVNNKLRQDALREIPFKLPQLHTGDFIMGADENRNPIRSPFHYLNAGSLLVANTGSGKTTMVTFYAVQIARHVKGMWLVDLRKKEYRQLHYHFATNGIDLTIIRNRRFKINPLQVPTGVDPAEYASTIADVLVRVLNLPHRASVLLSSTIITLYEQFNIFNGSCKYPTLFHLFESVRRNKDANSQAKQAILDNLETLLLAFGPEMLGYYRGWPVHELAQRHLALELAGQPEAGKDLILNYLVAAEFQSRLSQGISNGSMDLWMSLDEGQRLFSQRKETAGYGGNVITDLAGLVRGTGIGLFISALTPDDLSNRVPAITSTKIMGRCGSVSEYHAAGQFIGLSKEQIIWCAHHLVPGLFVGQASQGSWRYPFLFKIPKMNQLPIVTDRQADHSLEVLQAIPVEPVEFKTWPIVEQITTNDKAAPQSSPAPTTPQLNATEIKLLKAIIDHPLQPSSDYVKLAQVSPNTLAKLRPILLAKGLIQEHAMDSSARGRSKRIWQATEAAHKLIETTI